MCPASPVSGPVSPRRWRRSAELEQTRPNGLRSGGLRWFQPAFGPGGRLTLVRATVPEIFLIARPAVDLAGMRGYLEAVGGAGWLDRRLADSEGMPNPGELLVEFAGRACYRSWEPGLNPNVTRVRADPRAYLRNILKSAHGSVLEHANYSFALHNVSRVATHEIVRHRAGAAYSQESLRYVRLVDIGFRVPPALEPLRQECLELVERLEEFQRSAAAKLDLDAEGVPFHVKKEATSALRRLAPIGVSTDLILTMNLRTLRHVVEMRTAPGAEEELRLIFGRIGEIMVEETSGVFQDFRRLDDSSWVPEFRKV
ncbi:MAG: FAD-dependent thymidylate synthase [Candidatus Dormibacteraeota bacterium]|nr:FAD-dependent thymidylate synthase [Candidatus Dormibacteraeota bacterium]